MVSSAVKMDQKAVVAALKRLRAHYRDDTEYQKLRKDLPEDWPL